VEACLLQKRRVDVNKRIAVPLLLAACAAPGYAYDYTDTAEVVSAVPIYETVNEPRQQCWAESVTYYEESGRSNGGAIIGGITGGLLGAQVGRGSGRIAAAATAAAIGALVGDPLDNRYSSPVTRPVQRCNVVDNYRKTINGYQVTYLYNGRNATVILPYDPGPRVSIGVGITDNGGSNTYIVPQSHMVRPSVTRITYIDRDVPVWKKKPYKRPKHDRDWDD
jgi:uncharacterized protein YcfJ